MVSESQQVSSPAPEQNGSLSVDDLLGAVEECYERGWTDGLPVVPPVPRLVDRFLEHTDRAPDEVIWRMEQVRRACTVELAAINAAMAGCRPEYFPVVLAALEAAVDEGWPGNGAWQSTTGGGPLLIVNGPVRTELGFNAKGNVFGQGFRPNATVGRAIRLIIMNCYGIRPHELDQATQGTPGKYSLCIAENEEESPWEPLHVELGHPADASTVSALHTRSCEFVDNRGYPEPELLLNDIADTIARTGSLAGGIKRDGVWAGARKRVGVIFGPEHAQFLASHGYSKRDVKEYFAEHTGRLASDFRNNGRADVVESMPDNEMVKLLASTDDIMVAVAGAANAGVTTVAQPLGFPRNLPGCAKIRH